MSDKPDVEELVEVTDEDVAALQAAYTEQWGEQATAVYNADHWLAKAFARHRIATLTTLSRRNAELEGLVRRAAINLSETAYPSWHEEARTALGGSTDV